MNLKKIDDIPIYGNFKFRGNCPQEGAEQVTFFGWIRRQYPHTYGKIALHPRNEGKRSHSEAKYHKADGLTVGASDIVIPCSPAFVCELKRKDHTKSTISDEQIEFLRICKDNGSFVCIALGYEAAVEAFKKYLQISSIS